jgi:thioredoxin reductase (NADPH)
VADPILFVVDDDPAALADLASTLRRRFGADYRIMSDASAPLALGRIEQACRRGEEIALVVAGLRGADTAGLDWLARTRELCPRASRCVLVSYGDAAAYPLVRRALVLGQVDTYLLKPWGTPEERLYPVVSELLGNWVRIARPRQPLLHIVGEQWARRSHELRDLAERASIPYGFHAHDSAEGQRLLEAVGHAGALPAVILHDGRFLANPTNSEIARLLGARTEPERDLYDLVIVGAGPAGLAASVYAAADGLRTLVIERQVVGGQAGTSSLIRNYPGFPRGISGAALTSRVHEQAVSLGAEFLATRDVMGILERGRERILTLAGGLEVRTRAVVVATGVAYSRLEVDGVEPLMGKGVFYGAATAEAPAFAGQDIFIVGGGNSAGQAAAHLARYAATVTLLVRGPALSMSDYLVQQLGRTDNVRIRLNTRLCRAEGAFGLEALEVVAGESAISERLCGAAMFVMIGAGPHTSWLASTLQRDGHGYILTGRSVVRGAASNPPWPLDRPPYLLETSLPGVFAAGDVRHLSPRGVAAAVGDGSLAIGSVREYLSEA